MSNGAEPSVGSAPSPRLRLGALDRTLQEAIVAGILPPDARRPAAEARPWPVILLTALGAWLAAIPLIGMVGMPLGDLISRGSGPYLIGALVLALAVVVLRSRDLPLFLEQLALPALLVGCGTLALGLFRDLSVQGAAAWLALAALVLAAGLARPWLRVLLGAAAAGLFVLALLPGSQFGGQAWATNAWIALHWALAVWVAGLLVQQAALGRGGPVAVALEPIGAGWLLGTLAGLALVSGMTFLVGAGMDPVVRDLSQGLTPGLGPVLRSNWMPAGSTLLALGASLWGARVWPGLRRPWVLGVGLVAAALAWFLPTLGGVWLALVLTATSRRWRLAAAAALAAVWIIGSFYYQLQWPLATKALVLGAAGLLLGALAWLGGSGALAGTTGTRGRLPWAGSPTGPAGARWPIALTALATLAVVNLGIWEKESLIAQGRPVFVALAPVDPRSLMQGDFMRLAFQVPAALGDELGVPGRERRLVVAAQDARGVATLRRVAGPGEALAEGELLLELIPKAGRWMLVTDAWYFREGDAERWAAARFGELRVGSDGSALLVGLADAELRSIAP